MPIIGDPDPETMWRLELFFNAVALSIERATGVMVSPMMKMSHEGFGRMVLIGRPADRRSTSSCATCTASVSIASRKLAAEGEKIRRRGAIEMIEKFPEVAKY